MTMYDNVWTTRRVVETAEPYIVISTKSISADVFNYIYCPTSVSVDAAEYTNFVHIQDDLGVQS